MEIWAHGGRSSIKEIGNNSADITRTIREGVTGIEVDLCQTADGRIIIYHPDNKLADTLWYTTNELMCHGIDVFELKDLIKILKEYPETMCSLDLKNGSKYFVTKIAKLIVENKLTDRVYISCHQLRIPGITATNPEVMSYAKEVDSRIKVHVMACLPSNLTLLSRKYGPNAVSFGWTEGSDISKLFFKYFIKPTTNFKQHIKILRNKGVRVWGGVANRIEDMLYFQSLGVSGIVTDNVRLAMTIISTKDDDD